MGEWDTPSTGWGLHVLLQTPFPSGQWVWLLQGPGQIKIDRGIKQIKGTSIVPLLVGGLWQLSGLETVAIREMQGRRSARERLEGWWNPEKSGCTPQGMFRPV